MTTKVIKELKGGCRLLLVCPDDAQVAASATGDDPGLPDPIEDIIDIPKPNPIFPDVEADITLPLRSTPERRVPQWPLVVTTTVPTPDSDPVYSRVPVPMHPIDVHFPNVQLDVVSPFSIVPEHQVSIVPAGGGSGTVKVNTTPINPAVTASQQAARKATKVGRLANVSTIALDLGGYLADNVENFADIGEVLGKSAEYITQIPDAFADAADAFMQSIDEGDVIRAGTVVADSLVPLGPVARIINRVAKELGADTDLLPNSFQEALDDSRNLVTDSGEIKFADVPLKWW